MEAMAAKHNNPEQENERELSTNGEFHNTFTFILRALFVSVCFLNESAHWNICCLPLLELTENHRIIFLTLQEVFQVFVLGLCARSVLRTVLPKSVPS